MLSTKKEVENKNSKKRNREKYPAFIVHCFSKSRKEKPTYNYEKSTNFIDIIKLIISSTVLVYDGVSKNNQPL